MFSVVQCSAAVDGFLYSNEGSNIKHRAVCGIHCDLKVTRFRSPLMLVQLLPPFTVLKTPAIVAAYTAPVVLSIVTPSVLALNGTPKSLAVQLAPEFVLLKTPRFVPA